MPMVVRSPGSHRLVVPRSGDESGVGNRARPRQLGPIRAAYAIRWLELGNGASLPAWSSLLTMEKAAG
jgi:hypothetical protein